MLSTAIPSKSSDTGGISLQISLLRGGGDVEILIENTQWEMRAVTHRHLCFGRADLYFA
jgi:hypothetical protein